MRNRGKPGYFMGKIYVYFKSRLHFMYRRVSGFLAEATKSLKISFS